MIAIIANPNALRFNRNDLKQITDVLEKNGICVDIFFTNQAGDGTVIANKISSAYSIIAAYGGDGIVNEIVNADLGNSALGILPAGTTNVLSIDLKINKNPVKAAELFIKPKIKKAFLGCLNDKKFILMASAGFDAEAVGCVNQRLKKISGKFAYFWSGVVSYFKSTNHIIKVKIGKKTLKSRWVIVSKAKKYAGEFTISKSVDIFQPYFDVCLFEPIFNNIFDLPYDNFLLFSGLHNFKMPFVKHIITDENISIQKSNIQMDGDFFGLKEVEIRLCEKPINIVVP